MSTEAPTNRTVTAAYDERYERIAIRTHWITPGEDITDVVERYATPLAKPGDIVVLSEKVVVIARGEAIPAAQLRPGLLARALSRATGDVRIPGLNVPEKMQLVIKRCGAPRVFAAAVAAVVTKPLGISGVFYRIVGEWSQDIDGMSPPYPDLVIPPLAEAEAEQLCTRLSKAVNLPTAIIDINDGGGRVRATSSGVDSSVVLEAMRDNPLGQRRRGTPIGLLRRLAVG